MSSLSLLYKPEPLPILSCVESVKRQADIHGESDVRMSLVPVLRPLKNGFRYKSVAEPSSWALIFDLEGISAVLESTTAFDSKSRSSQDFELLTNSNNLIEYKTFEHLSTRGSYIGVPSVITCVSFVVRREDVDEVNRWYDQQHIDDLSRIPGWRRSRRFRLIDDTAVSNSVELLAIHDFDQENGLGGPEHMWARYRPWREKIVQLALSRTNTQFVFDDFFQIEDCCSPSGVVQCEGVERATSHNALPVLA